MNSDEQMINLIKGAAGEEQFHKISIEEMVKIYVLGSKLVLNNPYDDDLIKATDKFKAAIEEKKKEAQSTNQANYIPSRPAGFWMRFWAWCFDSVVLAIVFMVVNYFIAFAFGIKVIDFLVSLVNKGLTGSLGAIMFMAGFIVMWLATVIISWLLSQILGWMYYALFETGATHGTPGKLLFGLKVLGKNEGPMLFGRSTARHFLKLAAVIPFLFSLLALIVAMLSGQAIESFKMMGPIVGLFLLLTPILFLIFYGMAGWTKQRRALHDILSDCYVIRSKELSAQRVFGTIIGVIIFGLVTLVIIPSVFNIWANSEDTPKIERSISARSAGNNAIGITQPQTLQLPPPHTMDNSKMQSCGLPGMPENAVVHFVGVSNGKKELDVQLGESGHTVTEVEVIVDQTREPVILVLTASGPVVWKVSYTPRANITGVLVSGGHVQALLGIPKAIPHRVISSEQSSGCESFYATRENELNRAHSHVMDLVGKRIEHYYGASASNYFQIGGNPYVRPTDAVSSSEMRLEDYPVYKGEVPAGERGIYELQRQNKIRLATEADVKMWRGSDKRTLESSLRLGKAFVVSEQINLPPGLFGANRFDFIIPAGVSKPRGPKSHCNLYYLQDNTYE